jgi:16S rRNA (uracil1498-N3)-methyltransferase
MGAGVLQPVITRHTQVSRLNVERMQANVVEAAEQCGILALPECRQPLKLSQVLDRFDPARHLIFCDERDDGRDAVTVLKDLAPAPLSVLIGPEGGFSDEERASLRALPFVTPLPLGPRILRADTAGVAALAVVQAAIGDWL